MRTKSIQKREIKRVDKKEIKRFEKIVPRVLYGSVEFEEAYGICETKLSDLRSEGLPCCICGKTFIYYPREVDEWIKTNKRVQTVKIKQPCDTAI